MGPAGWSGGARHGRACCPGCRSVGCAHGRGPCSPWGVGLPLWEGTLEVAFLQRVGAEPVSLSLSGRRHGRQGLPGWSPMEPQRGLSVASSQGWSSFTTGASKFASAAKEGVSSPAQQPARAAHMGCAGQGSGARQGS